MIVKITNRFLSLFDVVILRNSSINSRLHSLNCQIDELSNLKKKLENDKIEKLEIKKEIIGLQGVISKATPNFDDDRVRKSEITRDLIDLQEKQIKHRTYTKWSIIDAISRDGNISGVKLACPICKEVATYDNPLESHCIFGGGILKRHLCKHCGVIFGPQKMLELSDAELDEEYKWHYEVYSEGDSTEQEKRAFYSLNPTKSGVYLNYGAGEWSRSIIELREEGWNVYGYEPHAISSNEHIIGDFDSLQKLDFDGVFSNNVIEHFKDPVKELLKIKSLLKNEGLMSHASPCFEYLYEFTRFHLFFYTGDSMEYIARKTGMEIYEFIVDGEFMNVVLKPN
ncbi:MULTISPECIES: class I SAM-dependent methyltransferase [Vibrio]|uniref:class I SAM-dependent methyltransferase n=1 Tax=Vibrio TaxID=662 RepID=UPI00352DC8CF